MLQGFTHLYTFAAFYAQIIEPQLLASKTAQSENDEILIFVTSWDNREISEEL